MNGIIGGWTTRMENSKIVVFVSVFIHERFFSQELLKARRAPNYTDKFNDRGIQLRPEKNQYANEN